MAPTQPTFSPEFLAGSEYFRNTRNKEGMEIFLYSHLRGVLPRKLRKHNDQIAFAFDIDGVLIRSKTVLPGAKESLEFLQRNGIPFIFLTNNGGATEKDHVALLGKRLGLTSLSEHQFVQSHSPFKNLVPSLGNKNILILGGIGNKIREVANSYGFKHVLTSSDIYKAEPTAYPQVEITTDYHLKHGGSGNILLGPDGKVKFSAVLVWSSPRDWGLDLQVIMDLLLSEKGHLGTRSPMNGDAKLPNQGSLQDEQPAVHFSNPDLTYATSHPHPRAAQGSFRAALEGLWSATTGGAKLLNCKTVGKPTQETYIFGEKTLMEWEKRMNGGGGKIRTVYMVGDNPSSDIQGANNFTSRHGTEWKSILVESGVHVAGAEPAHKPDAIMESVAEAVEWALWDAKLSDLEHIRETPATCESV